LVTLGGLLWVTLAVPGSSLSPLSVVLFCGLVVATMTFSFPLGGGSVSLMPMAAAAAYLTLGRAPAGWAVLVGIALHGGVRYWRGRREQAERRESQSRELVIVTLINATMHTAAILVGGTLFELFHTPPPLLEVDLGTFLSLLLFGLTYLLINYLLAGSYLATRRDSALYDFFDHLPTLALYEGGPLIFAPLMAIIYTRLGLSYFVLLSFSIVSASIIAQNLALTSQRLSRRVQELDSLQFVGQVLSASLEIETVVTAIYTQVARLMPAQEFYVALYDADADEVTFPLAVEEGQTVPWRSRKAGNGLTEYVLRTRSPLLIRGNVQKFMQEQLHVEVIGRNALCWLGVPILAGNTPLGVIAVQSYTTAEAYDHSHQEILRTIAAQAAVAIQNARLYASTDEALARRVQELNSILRTTSEGVLLLDLSWKVLAANRALAEMIGTTQRALTQHPLERVQAKDTPLLQRLAYSEEALRDDCVALAEGAWVQKQEIVLLGTDGRHVERTLTPVRDREGGIKGWLLIFRDMSEEVELARLREEMASMLIHDLRSPLTAVMASLGLMPRAFDARDEENFSQLLTIAQRSSERILQMVNQLLDISKLESGQLPLKIETINVEELLRQTVARFAPVATESKIALAINIEQDLPPLEADRQLLGRVLYNLLDNALKFTPDGGHVVVDARLLPVEAPVALQLSVDDDGPGIPQEAQSLLFEKFQQIPSTEGRRKGTGLGLAFCKLAVEAQGGRIWVESESGRGSTFLVTLPLDGHRE
jgi:PAS domain S-box-containing protein